MGEKDRYVFEEKLYRVSMSRKCKISVQWKVKHRMDLITALGITMIPPRDLSLPKSFHDDNDLRLLGGRRKQNPIEGNP